MSLVLYCPYLAFKSSLRMMLEENKVAVDILVGLLLWTIIVVNILWCVQWVQKEDTKQGELAGEQKEQEQEQEQEEDCDITEENSELLEENDLLKSELRELRQENNVLKAEVALLNRVPLKIIGMKIVGGFRRESITDKSKTNSLEDQVLQALADGWVISGGLLKSQDSGVLKSQDSGVLKSQDSGVWFQNLLRYEAAPAPAPAAASVPESTQDTIYMHDVEEVAKKIHSLSKEWRTARQIQKAVSFNPFITLTTINSALYTMLNKGEVVKDTGPTGAPVWKLV